MWSGRASAIVTSPPAMPTAARKVAATTRSGTTAWWVGWSSSTPSTSMREVPAPRTTAPMSHSMAARSATSGSFAAFSITVVPLASTAAMSRLSVAVWLGYSQHDPGPDQPAARHGPTHLAVGRLETGPHGAQPVEVEVDGAVAEVVPAGQGHPRRSRSGRGAGPRTTTEARIFSKSS